jgi:hypothetical protein
VTGAGSLSGAAAPIAHAMCSFIVWNFPASWHLPGLDRECFAKMRNPEV